MGFFVGAFSSFDPWSGYTAAGRREKPSLLGRTGVADHLSK